MNTKDRIWAEVYIKYVHSVLFKVIKCESDDRGIYLPKKLCQVNLKKNLNL
jgi:hypothetical protein